MGEELTTDPHPATGPLAYRGAGDLGCALDAGETTSAAVTAALLERIAALDPPGTPTALHSVIAVAPGAPAEAAARDEERRRGQRRGPLHGVPVVVKDNVEVAGLPSAAGSTALAGRPPGGDAPLVSRLREAGAVILATANLSEWANIRSTRSTGGWSAVGGLTANPWALDRNAGGSSSGSGAALAAGFAPLAVGTETDGSITCPCSLNGVAGIKPTVGAVPTAGVVPVSPSQDSPGPMARTVADVALLLEVLTATGGIVGRLAAGAAGVRMAVARSWRTGHPATDARFDEVVAALAGTGIERHDVDAAVPGPGDHDDELTVLLCELVDALDRYLPTRGPGPRSLAEVVAWEDDHAEAELAYFDHDLFERALALGGTAADAYRPARERNLAWALTTCLEPALAGADVLAAPTYGPAWKSDLVLGGHPAAASPVTMAPAIAGWPIATVPMGTVAGLPVGLGLVGRPGSEATLLAAAAAVESVVAPGGPRRPSWSAPSRS